MDPIRPLVVAGADYASSHDAAQDYQIVWTARHGGAFDHMSIALLTRDACGELRVERHNSAAKDLAWAGVVLRAALLVVVPAVRMATVAGGGAGAGGIAAHLRRMIPEMSCRGSATFSTPASPVFSSLRSTGKTAKSARCSSKPRKQS